MAAAAHFLIRKKLFNSKYPQLLVAKDFAIAEKKLHPLSAEENTTQERKHLRKDVPQMLKQQIPNHQLHKISHKTSPSLNNSHKVCLPLNNNHKVKQPLILNRDLSHHNSVMMTNFQMHLPLPQRLFIRKMLDLYQRNQNIVYDQKQSTFNPLYLCHDLKEILWVPNFYYYICQICCLRLGVRSSGFTHD